MYVFLLINDFMLMLGDLKYVFYIGREEGMVIPAEGSLPEL